jgi:hypothetical protein
MMFWIAGYMLFVAYAAGLFMYSVSHDRPWAAIGILLSVSGFQFAAMDTINTTVALGVAAVGLALVGRDLFAALQPRFAAAIVRNDSDSCVERV